MVRKSSKNTLISRKWLLYGLLCAFLLLGLVLILEYTHVTHFWGDPPANSPSSGPTPAQKKQESDTFAQEKKNAIENPPSESTPAPVTSSQISFTVQKTSDSSVTVMTNVGNVANGTCKLDVTNGTNSNSQTAGIIYQPEYSSCAGFSVPINSLGTGNWTLTLTVTSNGNTATKTVTQDIQ